MKTHIETITDKAHTYTVTMGGTLDGVNTRDPVGYSPYGQAFEPNHSVRMENVGDTDVVNPWIVVNGKRDWRSIDHILAEIIDDGMSDAEKARAIWEFARTHRYHTTCASDEVKDTVKMLNVYGYTLCWDEAYTVSNLWQAAGLKIRRGYPHGHCTTEVFYDGAYHLLDSDEHLLYHLRDNKTIASESDLSRDRDLVKRGHAYGILQPENPEGAQGAASLFFFTGERTGGRPRVGDHRMDLTLRPGEALVWEWEDRGKYHGYNPQPKQLSNGRMKYAPDLTQVGKWADRVDGWTGNANGLYPESPGTPAHLELSIRSPYAIVGGSVDLTLQRGSDDELTVSVTRDGQDWHPIEVPEGRQIESSLDLDPIFRPDAPASYSYTIRVDAKASDLLITGLTVETDLQMAPLSLPALELGENEVQFTSESAGQIRITHGWEEQVTDPAPDPPSEPDLPPDGGVVAGTQFTFSWPAVEGAIDYHFALSDRQDMKYALSPVFEKLTSKTPANGAAEWQVPFEGMLNPDQTYYWRVRARNGEGLWGDWSPTWSFTPNAPGTPLSVDVSPDWDDRTLTLSWQPNTEGKPPVRYEIYASDERGFTANRGPHTVVAGKSEHETFPANLLTRTDSTSLTVAGPDCESCYAFYRVVAVDAAEIRSGPSDFAEAPRPMIVSTPPPQAVVGESRTYPVRVTSAIGELRAERVGNKNYVSEFREADELRFLVDEGPPEWVQIDEKTGVFTAQPKAKHLGYHTITLRVQNGQGGFDMQGFDLEVVE